MQKQNLEVKYFCDDFSGVRTTLQEIGAIHEITKIQKDYFFDLPDARKSKGARLKLRIEDGHFGDLIYYERSGELGSGATSDVRLLPGNETVLKFYTDALGVVGIVDKERELWRKGDTVFHLDTLKEVGTLFEIELQKDSELTPEDRKTFDTYYEKIKPHLKEPVTGSNIDLVLKTDI